MHRIGKSRKGIAVGKKSKFGSIQSDGHAGPDGRGHMSDDNKHNQGTLSKRLKLTILPLL